MSTRGAARAAHPRAGGFGQAAPVLAALGEPARLRIVDRLCSDGPQSIARLTEGSRISRQAVTKHLQALAQAGLVRDRRVGRERVWQLETARLAHARRCLDSISSEWDAALGRLRALVEKRGAGA
jgi:DNA-binding transcriptional ArsR family regulator